MKSSFEGEMQDYCNKIVGASYFFQTINAKNLRQQYSNVRNVCLQILKSQSYLEPLRANYWLNWVLSFYMNPDESDVLKKLINNFDLFPSIENSLNECQSQLTVLNQEIGAWKEKSKILENLNEKANNNLKIQKEKNKQLKQKLNQQELSPKEKEDIDVKTIMIINITVLIIFLTIFIIFKLRKNLVKNTKEKRLLKNKNT
ncbi:hypothetical protein AB837_00581 [bacterium AB1]|nr:hypothetical protein AB837_00581 [bacterium AB1]